MKVLLLLGVIAAMAAIVLTRNAKWGDRVRGDKVLLNKTIVAFPRFGKYQDRSVKYDPNLQPVFFRNGITAIIIKDNFRNASGAEVHLVRGGIGKKFTTVRLHSQYSQGINSTVTVFGK